MHTNMKRNVFAQLRTLIYVTIVAVLSINLMACEPETPETPETPENPDDNGQNSGGNNSQRPGGNNGQRPGGRN